MSPQWVCVKAIETGGQGSLNFSKNLKLKVFQVLPEIIHQCQVQGLVSPTNTILKEPAGNGYEAHKDKN